MVDKQSFTNTIFNFQSSCRNAVSNPRPLITHHHPSLRLNSTSRMHTGNAAVGKDPEKSLLVSKYNREKIFQPQYTSSFPFFFFFYSICIPLQKRSRNSVKLSDDRFLMLYQINLCFETRQLKSTLSSMFQMKKRTKELVGVGRGIPLRSILEITVFSVLF